MFCRHLQLQTCEDTLASIISSLYISLTPPAQRKHLVSGTPPPPATFQWVYREAVKTMSLRMAKEAFSILLPRTESPTMRAACLTSFSTSSRRWMQRTTVPSWTSVSWAISAKGWDGTEEVVSDEEETLTARITS